MPTYSWSPSDDTVDYVLERSVDKGLTWTNITTIVHNYAGPDYDSSNRTFFYVDGASVLGEVVRLYGRNADGNGPAEYILGPTTTRALCNVFGVLKHAVTGESLRGVIVIILPSNSSYTTRQGNNAVPAFGTSSILGGKREFRECTDDDGRWSIDLVRGITVTVKIPDVGYEQKFIVPEDRDILNITDAYLYRAGSRFGGQQQNPWTQGPRFVP